LERLNPGQVTGVKRKICRKTNSDNTLAQGKKNIEKA